MATSGRDVIRGSWRPPARSANSGFVLDGEAVVLGVDGIADFNALHSRQHDEGVQFCAFDILVEGGDDLRKLPLRVRKNSLQRLLRRRPEASS
jgi:bifunctional non-homologous end joining protein LigD